MIFDRFPVASAAGLILGHSTRVADSKFKKGRVLSEADLGQLTEAGITHVSGARLESGDIHEDEAAGTLASAATGAGVRTAEAFTGRANLISVSHGIAVFDPDRVVRVNTTDESLTIATVAPFAVVRPRQILATIKVIPFSAPGNAVRDAAEAAAGSGVPLIRVAPFQDMPVGLIMTETSSIKTRVLDKTTLTIAARIEGYGAHLRAEIRCLHTPEAVAEAVKDLVGRGCKPIIVIGASAIVDRHDVVPMGIEAAGGVIDRFGMPVDPGNLLLLAHHGDVPVVGAPGCARSPRFNGFDWVLARMLAQVPVSGRDIAAMGTGGLLTDIATRPQPREQTQEEANIAAVVLAGGQSRRTGPINKLLATFDGKPMVATVVDAVLASASGPVVVVTGHEADEVREALAGRDVTFTHNPNYADGLSTSLRQGMHALIKSATNADGALVCLGDMPRVNAKVLGKLISAFNLTEGRSICVPTFDGKRGNPVLWGSQYFSEMERMEGDVGAKHMIGEYSDAVCEVPMTDDAVIIDLDTPEALTAAGAEMPGTAGKTAGNGDGSA
jgi:molybdenum cofactor cytidylyltransferase